MRLPQILLVVLVSFTTVNLGQAQAPSVNVQFVNSTDGEQVSGNMWINFLAGGAPVVDSSTSTVTYDAGTAIGTANIWNTSTSAFEIKNIYTNSSYNLGEVENGTFSLAGFGGGRAYVSYGQAMSGIGSGTYSPVMGPYPGWQPAPTPTNVDANFTVRYQAFELTVQANVVNTNTGPGPAVWAFGNTNSTYADLSYIDQVSISTGINVIDAPTGTTNAVQTSQNTKTLANAVGVIGVNSAGSNVYDARTNIISQATGTQYVQVAGESVPGASYQNPGSTSIANPTPDMNTLSNFVRVSGPGQMPTAGNATGPTTFYHSWNNYITALTTGGSLNPTGALVTSLTGSYGATGQPAQAYAGTATFHAGTVLLGGVSYTGYVQITGVTLGGAAQSDIYIPFELLNESTGLYGTNPGYSIGGDAVVTVPGNTFATRIVGDLVAGMNFGTVGSATVLTYDGTTQALGAFSSEDWWAIGVMEGNGYEGGYLFGGAQSDPEFYNTYAAALQQLTTAYAFGIQDRLGKNTTEFNLTSGDGNDSTVLQFLIQSDLGVVPEPGTPMLLGLGVGVLLIFARRRMRRTESRTALS